jgi:phosphoribosylglycinamide formyltransferase-1
MIAVPRVCVLISGGGTTLQNLIDCIARGELRAEIGGVISSRAEAFGVVRAKRAGLPCTIVESRTDPATFSDRVFAAVRAAEPDWVLLGGWLKLLKIPDDFRGRVLNIHPSLLPAFGGKGMYGHHVHEAVLRAGVPESGCTVHFVDDRYDSGPILLQRRVPVLPGDTPDSLAARVFAAECEAYPAAIRQLAGVTPAN